MVVLVICMVHIAMIFERLRAAECGEDEDATNNSLPFGVGTDFRVKVLNGRRRSNSVPLNHSLVGQ
jgi:hypothetical protein